MLCGIVGGLVFSCMFRDVGVGIGRPYRSIFLLFGLFSFGWPSALLGMDFSHGCALFRMAGRRPLGGCELVP